MLYCLLQLCCVTVVFFNRAARRIPTLEPMARQAILWSLAVLRAGDDFANHNIMKCNPEFTEDQDAKRQPFIFESAGSCLRSAKKCINYRCFRLCSVNGLHPRGVPVPLPVLKRETGGLDYTHYSMSILTLESAGLNYIYCSVSILTLESARLNYVYCSMSILTLESGGLDLYALFHVNTDAGMYKSGFYPLLHVSTGAEICRAKSCTLFQVNTGAGMHKSMLCTLLNAN